MQSLQRRSFLAFFLFDIGRITSVQSDSNNGATIKVHYGENFEICKVKLFMNDYVPAHVKIPQKSTQWRLLR